MNRRDFFRSILGLAIGAPLAAKMMPEAAAEARRRKLFDGMVAWYPINAGGLVKGNGLALCNGWSVCCTPIKIPDSVKEKAAKVVINIDGGKIAEAAIWDKELLPEQLM